MHHDPADVGEAVIAALEAVGETQVIESHQMQNGDKLSKKRRQFILDIADDGWMHRFDDIDDESALDRESRKWGKLRTAFLKEATFTM